MEDHGIQKSPLRRKSENSERTVMFVSNTPSNSSSGFANTFRVLENQIKRKLTKLDSINEEDPSALELELSTRGRLTELCDTNISLNNLNKFDEVQNFIYHVSKNRNGVLTVKPKHLTPSIVIPSDEYGKLTFCFHDHHKNNVSSQC